MSSGSPGPPPTSATVPAGVRAVVGVGDDHALLHGLVDGRPDRGRAAVFAAGQHADRQPGVVERRRRDSGAFAGDVGADAEDPPAVGLVDDRGVDLGVVGGRDRVPGAVQITVAVVAQGQGDLSLPSPMASTAGVAALAMTWMSAPLAMSRPSRRCATVPPPTTTTFLPASRTPTR